MEGCEWSSFGTGNIKANLQQEGLVLESGYKRKGLPNLGVCAEAQFLKVTRGTQSGPYIFQNKF